MNDKQQVELAASILDADKPGWYKLVDLKQLVNLEDSETCVLGQVYGSWVDNHDRLFGNKGLIGVTSYNEAYLEYWRELIALRQGKQE
jgi:hypothetical protein